METNKKESLQVTYSPTVFDSVPNKREFFASQIAIGLFRDTQFSSSDDYKIYVAKLAVELADYLIKALDEKDKV